MRELEDGVEGNIQNGNKRRMENTEQRERTIEHTVRWFSPNRKERERKRQKSYLKRQWLRIF